MENSEYLQCLIDFPLATPSSFSSLEPPTSHFTGWSEEDINQLDSFDFPLAIPVSLSSSEPPTSHFTGWSEKDINQLDSFISTTPGQTVEQHQDIHPLISDLESEIKSKKKPRRKSVPWTKDEHRLFLLGLQEFGKGDWKNISRHFVVTKDAIQVASHAQKYFIRRDNPGKYSGRKSSIFDIHTIDQPIEPKSQRNQSYIPIAPSPLPPSPPIIQSRLDYNLLQGSGTPNRYHPSNLFPIKNFSYQADPVNMDNIPSSATYSLDEPWSSSLPFGTFSFANNM